jgi:ubiquinone/menaquinone biosynthesis C-methylase UbiE
VNPGSILESIQWHAKPCRLHDPKRRSLPGQIAATRKDQGFYSVTNYIFDNAAEREAAQRFSSLEQLHDPHTIRHLLATGVGPGWRCWEIGGGSGSVGRWLVSRVAPNGRVLMTDIDPRFISNSGIANLEVRRHDVGIDSVPETGLDLIHVRLVLIHVPQRNAVLERLVNALKPGGWLIVEDYDPVIVDRAFPTVNVDDAAVLRKCLRALRALMESRGMDMSWGSSLYRRFVDAGLTNVGMEGQLALRPGGSAGAQLDEANLSQVRDAAVGEGLVTPDDITRIMSLLEDPGFVFASPVMFTAWGQRRQAPA